MGKQNFVCFFNIEIALFFSLSQNKNNRIYLVQ